MKTTTIAFRLAAGKKKLLDALAQGMDRDRTYVINEAIEAYLDVHQWQIGHIREALREADQGRFATPAQVKSAFGRWRR